jgi:CSLREA domain-containing protein
VTLVAIVFLAGTAAAATFDVTSTMDQPDSNPGDGVCSSTPGVACTLRAAIQEANALAGDDVINLPAGNFILTIAGTLENAAATGDLDVVETVWIYGEGIDVTRIDAGGLDRVFDVHSGVLQLVGLTVTGGRANSASSFLGGGIQATGNRLVIGNCRLTDNVANQGGAIFASSATFVQIADSILDDNATEDLKFTNPWGGAIRSEGGLSLEGSTVTGSTAGLPGNYAVDVQCYSGSVSILNSTIAANSCAGIGTYSCDTTLSHVTVADNTSSGIAFGSYDHTADLSVANSIIAGNSEDCNLSPLETVAFDHCLDSDDSCGLIGANGDLPLTDPQLLPLRNWGGLTPTMYPRPVVSPVIDAGNGAICYVTDQRGEVRGGDGNGDTISGCDIGAVEATDLVFFDDLEDGSTTWWSAAVGLAP